MKLYFAVIIFMVLCACQSYNNGSAPCSKCENLVGVNFGVFERELEAGESLDSVVKKLSELIEITNADIRDGSASLIGVDFDNQDPLVQKEMLMMEVYTIDLMDSYGVELQFNFRKNLIGFVAEKKFKQSLK